MIRNVQAIYFHPELIFKLMLHRRHEVFPEIPKGFFFKNIRKQNQMYDSLSARIKNFGSPMSIPSSMNFLIFFFCSRFFIFNKNQSESKNTKAHSILIHKNVCIERLMSFRTLILSVTLQLNVLIDYIH